MESILVSASKPGEGKWFESLWEEQDLTDVTLVCRDGSQLMAHKTVLALSSPLLRRILTKSKMTSQPTILLLTVDALVLERLLRLIYFGEVSLPASNTNTHKNKKAQIQIQIQNIGELACIKYKYTHK